MHSGLTELGLARPAGAGAEARAGSLARFVARVLAVVAEFAPRGEGSDLRRLPPHARRLQRGGPRPGPPGRAPRDRRALRSRLQGYFKAARAYGIEREHELTAVVSLLHDAARITVGESKHFNAQVLATSARVETIAQLDDIRDLRRRLAEEVSGLRQAVADKQKREEAAFVQLSGRVEVLQARLAELELEVTVDALTKVANRGSFDRVLVQMLAASHRNGTPLALAMNHVDHF